MLRPYVKLRPHADRPWPITDLCKAYNWPSKLPGGGVIAIVELGGGWVKSDLESFFESIGQPVPSVVDISVDGTNNSPGDDADTEVALDIEIAAASYFIATGKAAVIKVYWAEDIQSAVAAAAKDGCDVCSISWGADEAEWGAEECQAMEQAAIDAAKAGMVILAAAGDNDSSDGGPSPANVDCPASCPHIISCGGTSKTLAGETVWNNNPGETDGEGTGGGFSTVFPAQPWQVGVPATGHKGPGNELGRMVPDVAADADPETGYQIWVDGGPTVVGGTSAVAPLYAGLLAAAGKKLGFVTPKLWQNPGAFVDITQGGNGAYQAVKGPDPCTGLGAPKGAAIAALFTAPVAAPKPAPPAPPAPASGPTSGQQAPTGGQAPAPSKSGGTC